MFAQTRKAKQESSSSSSESSEEDDVVCEACNKDENDNKLILCDTCDDGYHTYCLKPKLNKIPEGEWHCPKCQVHLPLLSCLAMVLASATRTVHEVFHKTRV